MLEMRNGVAEHFWHALEANTKFKTEVEQWITSLSIRRNLKVGEDNTYFIPKLQEFIK